MPGGHRASLVEARIQSHRRYREDVRMASRRLRWFVATLVAFALLVVGAYAAVKTLLGSDRVRVTLEQKLTEYLGQPVRIGSAGATLFPPSIDLREVSLGSPAA